jgi:hypothetical protein
MTPGDPWIQQFEAFGRSSTGQRKLAKRQLRELAARTAGQQAIAATQPTQRALVEAVQAGSHALEKLVPAGAVAPTVDGIPTAHDVLRDGFASAEQLIAVQRDFTERVVAAARPVLDKQA